MPKNKIETRKFNSVQQVYFHMASIYNKHIKYKNYMKTLRVTFKPGTRKLYFFTELT